MRASCSNSAPTERPSDTPCHPARRHWLSLGAATATLGALGLAGCALPSAPPRPAAPPGWQSRLRGNTLALLGETHDHPELHQRRLTALRAAFEAGWRPTVVMEQFDTERQDAIERARSERPDDAAHLITRAGAARGWDWPLYEPLIALVLRQRLLLVAGNLSRARASGVVRQGYGAAFPPEEQARLGLTQPLPAGLEAAQRHEIDVAHCGGMPAAMLDGMARAQFARDALMAERIRAYVPAGGGGVVLIAGNGHVRRDLGVPRWLGTGLQNRTLVVGFIERRPPGVTPDTVAAASAAYDATVAAEPVDRPDPCRALMPPPGRPGDPPASG